jgi:hypothetical protein
MMILDMGISNLSLLDLLVGRQDYYSSYLIIDVTYIKTVSENILN